VADEEDPSCPAGSASFRLIPVASDRRRRRPPSSSFPVFHSSLFFFLSRFTPGSWGETDALLFSEPTAHQGPEKPNAITRAGLGSSERASSSLRRRQNPQNPRRRRRRG
jgi:hypothetical protein